MRFNRAFIDQVRSNKVRSGLFADYWVPEVLLAIDPGETTGWCVFIKGEVLDGDDTITINKDKKGKKTINYLAIRNLINMYNPTYITIEDYKVYADKLDQHSYTDLITPKIIGAVEMYADLLNISTNKYMAGVVKPFWKGKMKSWGINDALPHHARDAFKHGAYFLLFHPILFDHDSDPDN